MDPPYNPNAARPCLTCDHAAIVTNEHDPFKSIDRPCCREARLKWDQRILPPPAPAPAPEEDEDEDEDEDEEQYPLGGRIPANKLRKYLAIKPVQHPLMSQENVPMDLDSDSSSTTMRQIVENVLMGLNSSSTSKRQNVGKGSSFSVEQNVSSTSNRQNVENVLIGLNFSSTSKSKRQNVGMGSSFSEEENVLVDSSSTSKRQNVDSSFLEEENVLVDSSSTRKRDDVGFSFLEEENGGPSKKVCLASVQNKIKVLIGFLQWKPQSGSELLAQTETEEVDMTEISEDGKFYDDKSSDIEHSYEFILLYIDKHCKAMSE